MPASAASSTGTICHPPCSRARPEHAGSVRRVPAAEIEALVVRSVREHLKLAEPIDDRSLINTHVARVEVQPEQLVIQLAQAQKPNRQRAQGDKTLHVPWHKTPSTRRREILLPAADSAQARSSDPFRDPRDSWSHRLRADAVGSMSLSPIRTQTRKASPSASGCSVRKVNMTISLAFLAPDLVKAAIEGRLPHGMGVARLADLPAEWSRQHQMLGLPSA